MSIFGSSTGASGGLFGTSNPTTSGTPNATTNQPSLFGTKPANSGGLFGGTQTTNSSGETNSSKTGLFGGGSAPAPAVANVSGSTGNTPTGTALPSIFGNTGPASTGAGTTPSNPLFGGTFPPKPADQNATSTQKHTGTSLFGQASTSSGTGTASVASGGLFGKTADSTSGASTPSNNLLGGFFGKPAASGSGTSIPTSTSTAAPAATSSILGLGLKPASEKDGLSSAPTPASALNLFGARPAEEKKNISATTGASSPFTLGLTKPPELTASNSQTAPATVAVAVAPPSMLRGKTIEEIVNKWSIELETHVREFNKFASEVAVWDRALIENGNNLSALYSHVQSAERDQNDIDQSLDHIEQQQKELASTLDAYEKVTQEIIGGQGGGLRALDTGPADTERDKNYMLATDLHTHLDDLSGSLTQMIESVNAMSLTSNNSAPAAEDPMGQIAQILSSHLESLQWIDGAVREVESKVVEVERSTKDSGYSVPATSPQTRSFGLNR